MFNFCVVVPLLFWWGGGVEYKTMASWHIFLTSNLMVINNEPLELGM
jgi:hypothetical protein